MGRRSNGQPHRYEAYASKKDEVIRRYNAFEVVSKIAQDTGLPYNQFYYILKYWGVASRDPKLAKPYKRTRKQHIEGKRECSICHNWLTFDNFTKDSKVSDGLSTRCKACIKEYVQPLKPYERHGLSEQTYLSLLNKQEGLCAICKNEPKNRAGESIPLVLDHDHVTGRVRGLLCPQCNAAEGHLKTPEIAYKLYAYMLKHGL